MLLPPKTLVWYWSFLLQVIPSAFIGQLNRMCLACTLLQKFCRVSLPIVPSTWQLKPHNLTEIQRLARFQVEKQRSFPPSLVLRNNIHDVTLRSPSVLKDAKDELEKIFIVPHGNRSNLGPYVGVANAFVSEFGDGQATSDRLVTKTELIHYSTAVEYCGMRLERYREAMQAYFNMTFMDPVAIELSSRLGVPLRSNFLSNRNWKFHLLPFISKPNEHGETKTTQFKYQPRSDYEFRNDADKLPRLLVQIQSHVDQEDETRMLLQAAVVVRLAQNAINKSVIMDKRWRFIITCYYVNKELEVKRYLMCSKAIEQPSAEVIYRCDKFCLTSRRDAFKFLLGLYNSPSVIDWRHPIDSEDIQLDLNDVELKKYKSLTTLGSGPTSRKRKPADDNGGDQSQARTPKSQKVDDPAVTNALQSAGYSLIRPDPNRWTLLDEPSSISSPSVAIVRRQDEEEQQFIIKVVEGPDYEETEIHRSLASMADPKNHTIKIIEVLESGGYQILVLPLGKPLRTLKSQLDTALASSLCEQLLEAVGFMHSQGFVHLDLKPDNLVVTGDTLQIIDFGLSCRVGSDTLLRGFRGTTTWVAPEVGENEGPKQTFEPIPVDLWATGSIILRFFGAFLPAGHQLFDLAGQLTSPDPKARPRLDPARNLKKRPIESHNLPLTKHIRRDYAQHSRLEYAREFGYPYSVQPFEQTSVR
ncbi:kinase-like protein [Atractiella rhizophila]|nr:kinase-like protein [Atractiella rhizophila]